MRIEVREMREEDAPAVARLAGQLGYPQSAEKVSVYLAALRQSEADQVFVAESEGKVVGWIHVHAHRSLVAEPRGEIEGLVVDEAARGQGIGRLLMERAEAWTRERGFEHVRLRSQTKREGAHRFYESLGYEILKTSHVLGRKL